MPISAISVNGNNPFWKSVWQYDSRIVNLYTLDSVMPVEVIYPKEKNSKRKW